MHLLWHCISSVFLKMWSFWAWPNILPSATLLQMPFRCGSLGVPVMYYCILSCLSETGQTDRQADLYLTDSKVQFKNRQTGSIVEGPKTCILTFVSCFQMSRSSVPIYFLYTVCGSAAVMPLQRISGGWEEKSTESDNWFFFFFFCSNNKSENVSEQHLTWWINRFLV